MVVVVVSVVSLLSLLLFGLITIGRAAASGRFLFRRDVQPSVVPLALPLTCFGGTPVVHTLASLLPVLLSLPVLHCLHRRSVHGARGASLSKIAHLCLRGTLIGANFRTTQNLPKTYDTLVATGR